MKFGALDNIIYIIPSASAAIVLLGFYGWWRRYSIKRIFQGRVPDYLRSSAWIIFLREFFIIISILLFVVVLLKPQWGTITRPVTKEGSDLLVLLDVSRSMDSEDVAPSRLIRAKNALKLLSASLEGDRAGLIVFAGEPFLMTPFTSDIGAFHMFLDSVSSSTLALQGTDIGGALKKASEIFEKKKLTNRIVLLITDGEDHENRVDEVMKVLKNQDVKVFTASLGTDSPSVIPQSDGTDIYVKDINGETVKTRVNTSLLRKIASETGGRYLNLNQGFDDLKFIKSELKNNKTKSSDTRMITEPKEKFRIFALFLLFFLILEPFIVKYGGDNES
ncbi:MAG: VWA domain-containing protein [Spirochaetes bacterium]|nr:VWA domain-containing protein [Spirochaetota bacterium]